MYLQTLAFIFFVYYFSLMTGIYAPMATHCYIGKMGFVHRSWEEHLYPILANLFASQRNPKRVRSLLSNIHLI